MSHVTCYVSHVTCQVSCVRCHESGVRCQVSCVRCHVSGVMWQVPCVKLLLFFSSFSFLSFCGQSGGDSWQRVCYQRGLPCLVKSPPGKLLLPSFSPSSCQCSAGEQSSWLPSPAPSLHEGVLIANPGYLPTC